MGAFVILTKNGPASSGLSSTPYFSCQAFLAADVAWSAVSRSMPVVSIPGNTGTPVVSLTAAEVSAGASAPDVSESWADANGTPPTPRAMARANNRNRIMPRPEFNPRPFGSRPRPDVGIRPDRSVRAGCPDRPRPGPSTHPPLREKGNNDPAVASAVSSASGRKWFLRPW